MQLVFLNASSSLFHYSLIIILVISEILPTRVQILPEVFFVVCFCFWQPTSGSLQNTAGQWRTSAGPQETNQPTKDINY